MWTYEIQVSCATWVNEMQYSRNIYRDVKIKSSLNYTEGSEVLQFEIIWIDS